MFWEVHHTICNYLNAVSQYGEYTYIYIYKFNYLCITDIAVFCICICICIYIYIWTCKEFFSRVRLACSRLKDDPAAQGISSCQRCQPFKCQRFRWNSDAQMAVEIEPPMGILSKTCYIWRFFLGSPWIQEIPEFDVPKPWHNMFWQSNVVVERYPRSWGQHLWPNMRGEASISGFGCTPADYHGR